MYMVIEFEENELAIVPKDWISSDGTKAYWPPLKSSKKLQSAVLNHIKPGEDWTPHKVVRVMYKTDSYEKAKEKVKQAEIDSDLHSDDQVAVKRKKRPNPKFESSESDSSDETELPVPPKKVQCSPQSTGASRLSSPPIIVSTSSPLTSSPSPMTLTVSRATCPPESSRVCSPAPRTTHSTTSRTTEESDGARQIIPGSLIRILTVLEEVREDQNEMRGMLSQILQTVHGKNSSQVPEGISLPGNTLEELNAIEESLQEPATFRSLIDYFAGIGGSSVKAMTKRILKVALTNQLATLFNWTGSKNKQKFSSLRLLLLS